MYNTSYVLLYRVLCLSTQNLQDVTAHVLEFCNSFRWKWGWRKVRPGHTSHKSPHGAQTITSSQWPGISQYVSASIEHHTAAWLNIHNHLYLYIYLESAPFLLSMSCRVGKYSQVSHSAYSMMCHYTLKMCCVEYGSTHTSMFSILYVL